ncbi:MAG: ABC transporter ATP-binding protein [Gammaproteobacteria bacterium]|nr:ABC transporter ATP-binding protein [Gammaproteobacteria bacterium]
MSLLATENLTLAAGPTTLCRDLTVQFHEGENWAILGANGSGKTTLLHTLAGLRPAESGIVLLRQTEISRFRHIERAKQLGLLLQQSETVFPATVMETVLTGRHPYVSDYFWRSIWQWESQRDYQLAHECLQQLQLSGMSERRIDTLSGGEKRRVEIATLLAQDPAICLLDEPNNELDLNFQLKILSLFQQRTLKPEHLNIMVLHDVNLALRFCSHAILLFPEGTARYGKISELLNTETLEQLYQCPFHCLSDDKRTVYLPGN